MKFVENEKIFVDTLKEDQWLIGKMQLRYLMFRLQYSCE